MKLNELIEALAGEIELSMPLLNESLDQMVTGDAEDAPFLDAMDQYSGQVQRMGEAAELAGFPGLQDICGHVLENTLLLATQAPEERKATVEFLRKWPELMVFYLRNTEDPSSAAGLVDILHHAPLPLEEDQALKIMHKLGSLPAQLKGPAASGEEHLRPLLARPEDVALQIPEDVDQKVLEGFFQEAPDQAAYLVKLIRNLTTEEGDSSDIIAAKRVAHTLKGSGAIIGLRGLVSLGHNMEDILEYYERHEGETVDRTVGEILLDGAFCLEQMVNYLCGGDEFPQQAQSVFQNVLDVANLIDRGDDLSQMVRRSSGGEVAPAPAPQAGGVQAAARAPQAGEGPTTAATLRVNLRLVEELFRVSGEVSVTSAAMEAGMKALADQARELVRQNLRVQRRLMELENLVDVRALTMMRARSRRAEDAAFDPLELDQYSELHSTTHALVEESSDLRELTQRLEAEISSVSAIQSRQQVFSRDLQHLVNGTRMTEVGVLESRLQRNVRTTAQSTGKEAVLELVGGDTLIDSDVLNKLAEPLLHLLRNAVDHGIESPAEREAAGKPAVGHITLSFALQGQQISLRCQDDGSGLDYDAIRRRGEERGLIPQGAHLTEDELAQLIMMPGFSTRSEVSEVSGRGVGLDVVHEWVTSKHGTLHVSSVPGEGTTFELRFAASLSTVYSMIVGVGDNRFALPSVHVVQAIARGVGSFEQVGEQLVYRNENSAMVAQYLSDLVGLPPHPDKKPEDYDVIIVRLADKIRAVLVDSLLDARDLLVIYPGRFGRHARGVAGLSILGDGSVAVDIDVQQLFSGGTRSRQIGASTAEVQPAEEDERAMRRSVLVVDDALTVRNSLQELLEDAGFRTETAKDGIEAVNMLGSFKPDMILTDLEMPNMNGIELTNYVRNNDETKNLPVIMITSRSLEKHRALADNAGVNE